MVSSATLSHYNQTMFRLAHISDVHLGPLPSVSYRELASKRVVGYVNWQRNRRRFLHDGVTGSIITDIKSHHVDHIAVTGDLVNLALDGEVEMARLWLEALGSGHDVSVVPGNHDAYVPGAFDKVCRSWRGYMCSDDHDGAVTRETFPYSARPPGSRADRRDLVTRDGAFHGDRLFPSGSGRPTGASA